MNGRNMIQTMPGGDPLKFQKNRVLNYGNPEDFDQPLYDRMGYPAAGVSSLSFFSIPNGQSTSLVTAGAVAARSKTYRDTNLSTAGQLSGNGFVIEGLSVAYIHEDEGEVANPTDRDKLRNGGWCEFKVGDKLVLRCPLVSLPELNPIVIGSTTATTTTMIGSVGGGSYLHPIKRLKVPVPIPSNQFFTFVMYWDGGTVTVTKQVDILLMLHGYNRRPS